MPRQIKVAAAQMGPNNEGTPREEIVERMLVLLESAARDGVELIAYPEMALTTYFPKKIRRDFDQFFESEVPPKALEPLLRRAAEARIAVHVGFCEKAEGKYWNTALLTDRDGRLCGTFRKIHLPGTKAANGGELRVRVVPHAHRPDPDDPGAKGWDFRRPAQADAFRTPPAPGPGEGADRRSAGVAGGRPGFPGAPGGWGGGGGHVGAPHV